MMMAMLTCQLKPDTVIMTIVTLMTVMCIMVDTLMMMVACGDDDVDSCYYITLECIQASLVVSYGGTSEFQFICVGFSREL